MICRSHQCEGIFARQRRLALRGLVWRCVAGDRIQSGVGDSLRDTLNRPDGVGNCVANGTNGSDSSAQPSPYP